MAKKVKEVAAATAAPTLEYISLDLIFPSPLNPRKEFQEEPLAELVESIKKLGVIQPITVRKTSARETTPGVIMVGDFYELVCGERRYRSAKVAGLTEIPCSIRVLTDAEAMELMITENLQRKDVHPLEEANAFNFMIESMGYELVTVGGRVGKGESFVARRLQLVKLIPELQEAFKCDKITIGHAELLCRIAADDQLYWFTNTLEGYNGAGTVRDLKNHLNYRVEKKLASATFKTDIPFAETIACSVCPANSACNSSLFPDKAEQAICHNSACFNKKTEAAFAITLKEALEDPFTLLTYGYDGENSEIVKRLIKEGYTFLKEYSDFHTTSISVPVEPIFASYDIDDYESPEELKADYESDLESYPEALQEYNKTIGLSQSGDGNLRKAFYVAGNNQGKYTFILLTSSKAKVAGAVNNEENKVNEQKSAIKQKATRGRELDLEKLHKRVVDHTRELPIKNNYNESKQPLSAIEEAGLFCMVYESIGYQAQKQIHKLLNLPGEYYKDGQSIFNAILNAEQSIRTFMIRTALFNKFSGSFPSGLGGSVTLALAKEWDPTTFETMFNDQEAIRIKREARLQERITELDPTATLII
jgi:ParB family chromosome partitioning protein